MADVIEKPRIEHNVEILGMLNTADMDRLVEVWTLGFPGSDPELLRSHTPEIVADPTSGLAVARNPLGYIASVIVVNINPGRDKRRGTIDDVATHPDSFRQGYAGAVLDFCIDWFRDRDVTSVSLTSSDARLPAHGLYYSRGFQVHDTNLFKLDLA